ncbi:MAG: hypothetical protein ACE15B_07430 [Bryobacteraceae bacterium]
MRKRIGWALFAAGSWMLVAPQSLTGLAPLQWMHRYAFPGEAPAGILTLGIAYYLLGFKPRPRH